MQLDDVTRWSRRHSAAAAVLVVGAWVRVAGPAGVGADVLFGAAALDLIGALVSRSSSSTTATDRASPPHNPAMTCRPDRFWHAPLERYDREVRSEARPP